MRSIVVVALLAGVAHAEPQQVNLLVSVPTTVAVSSTVANANIVPDHLVDGKLSTAWNSKTGELVGSWIAVRVPADTTVKTIKLTVGFAHKDRTGDLFTMNPRITKVRVSRAGKVLVEQALDPANRGLQDIAVDVAGGDLEIRVLAIVPGSKPKWKETCVSELEVWGTAPKIVKSKPAVRVGSLDAVATLTREQCIKAVFPTARGNRVGPDKADEAITGVAILPVRADIAICRIDHAEAGSPTTTVDVAAVRIGARPALLGAAVSETTVIEDRPNEGTGDKGDVTLEVFPLTATESGVLVRATQSKYGPMLDEGTTDAKLYRVTSAGLTEILSFESRWSDGEASASDRCALEAVARLGKGMPSLVVACVKSESHWHNDDPNKNGTTEKTRKQRFSWKGKHYEPR